MAFSGRADEIELKVVMTLSGTISMISLTDGSDIVKKKKKDGSKGWWNALRLMHSAEYACVPLN